MGHEGPLQCSVQFTQELVILLHLEPEEYSPQISIHCNVVLPSTPLSSKRSLYFTFPQTKPCIHSPFFSHIATCTVHLIFLDFIALSISCGEYIPRSSEVYHVLEPPDTFSQLCPDVFVSLLLSITFAIQYLINATDQTLFP